MAETTVTALAGVPPNDTAEPAVKPVPVMVTDVPPPGGPWFGLIEMTEGSP